VQLLAFEPPVAGSIPISNRSELEAISRNTRGRFHLTADIDLSDGVWRPIAFTGIFDGQGHVIRNMTVRSTSISNFGLFASTNSSAIIRNVGLEGVNVLHERSGYAGGIVGTNHGTITNSYTIGSVESQGGETRAGGIAGVNYGTISNCFSLATVTARNTTSSSRAASYAGGVVGRNMSTASIINCYSAGIIASTTEGNVFLGGVSGSNEGNSIIRSSYWLIESEHIVNGSARSDLDKTGIGIGMGQAFALTSSQMQTRDSYVDWDFDSVWMFAPGYNNGFPVLRAFHEAPVLQVPISVSATASPANGGSVTGGGTYLPNAAVTLRASPNAGFKFDGWFEGGTRVGTSLDFSFTAAEDRSLQARFQQEEVKQEVKQEVEVVIPGTYSPNFREELERAIIEDLVPPLLREPSVDLRAPITRVEFAGIVVLTYENLTGNRLQPATGTSPFTDTADVYARMAYSAGIMIGVSGTSFAPDTILNRETAATALTRVFKKWHFPGWIFENDANFPLNYSSPQRFVDDSSISGWARDSVYFMAANRIILGFPDNTFAPRRTANDPVGYANATREQALVIALRMVENMR